MFPNPEMPQPESKVVQFPFPQKVEEFRDVHFEELDKRFRGILKIYEKMRQFHLNRGRYHDLEHHFVTLGGLSPEVFNEFLKRKGFTWDEVTPIGEILEK